MKTVLTLVGLGAFVLSLAAVPCAAAPIATVAGVVTDEDGSPLKGVKVQLCAIEKLREGAWVLEMRLGAMPWWKTDEQGRFVVEFDEPEIRYDLWFEKRGFAPKFLYGISAKSGDLKVVLERGVVISGTVMRLVEGREKPVEEAKVVLSAPGFTKDVWYGQESLTDHEGRYRFRASPAPEGKKWRVAFLNEGVDLEIGDEDPVAGPDFVVTLEVRENRDAVQQPPQRDK